MPRYDLVVNAIDALSNRIHGMSEDERRHQERMNAFGLTSAKMGLEAEQMRGQQAIQMEQAKRDKYLDEMTTLGEAVSSSKLPDAQKKIVLSQMSPEMRALPTTRRKAATSFFEAFKSRQKAQTEAAKRESDIKQKELDRASRERVAGINREARIEAAKVRTQKPTSELKRMEVNAWKAYLNGKATPRQEKLIGVDKDPNIGRAIELIKNDDTMYGKSTSEVAQRALELSKELAGQKPESDYEYNPKEPDYDMNGYKAKYGEPDQSKGQHLTDEFKLPNHITFSNESKYSKPGQEGGEWKKIDGKWHFKPSSFNLKQHSGSELKKYFKKYEPDAVLDLNIVKTGIEKSTGKKVVQYEDGTLDYAD